MWNSWEFYLTYTITLKIKANSYKDCTKQKQKSKDYIKILDSFPKIERLLCWNICGYTFDNIRSMRLKFSKNKETFKKLWYAEHGRNQIKIGVSLCNILISMVSCCGM